MDATKILTKEHKAIELVLTAMERVADKLETGEQVDLSIVDSCLDFLSGFVDACHHAKEEALLFPLLEQRGVRKEGGPIGQMLHEHDEGRNLYKSIEESLKEVTIGSKSAVSDLIGSLRCYVTLLRSHIMKENEVLFPVAEAALSDEDNKNLIRGFNDIEEVKVGPGVHERYHELLDDLAERVARL